MKTMAFWLVIISGVGASMALNIQTTQQGPFLEAMGIDKVIAGTVLGTMGLIGIPARFASGWLADLWGKNSIRFIYALALALEGIGMVILTQASDIMVVWAFAIAFGIGQGMTVTMPMLLVAQYFGPGAYGKIYAMRTFFLRFGTVGGPIFAAWIWDVTGSYTTAFYVVAVVLAFATVLLLMARPPQLAVKVVKEAA